MSFERTYASLLYSLCRPNFKVMLVVFFPLERCSNACGDCIATVYQMRMESDMGEQWTSVIKCFRIIISLVLRCF